jgi:predicted HicB family RNase H-like nuclease
MNTNRISYRGYDAHIEYDDGDAIFCGRIAGIRDGVGFHADTVAGLKKVFRQAVDNYIETVTWGPTPWRKCAEPRSTGGLNSYTA